jgi:hypothetical protein
MLPELTFVRELTNMDLRTLLQNTVFYVSFNILAVLQTILAGQTFK